MNKIFPDIIRPIPDEILSSWIHRAFLSDIKKKYNGLARLSTVEDPDFADRDLTYQVLQSVFNYPQQCCETLLPVLDFWVSPIKYRFNYCPHCIWDDIIDGNHPAYRKQWAYRWSVVCLKHQCPLLALERYTNKNTDTVRQAASILVKNNELTNRPYLPQLRYLLMLASRYPDCGYIYVAAHFQKWLSDQIKHPCIVMPNGQKVSNYHFFDMLDTVSLSMMRRTCKREEFISQAYSYLPPRKWPRLQEKTSSLSISPCVDIASLDPRDKAGFLAFIGVLIDAPMCKVAWKLVSNNNLDFLFPDSKSLFPKDHRQLQNLIIAKMEDSMNPLKNLVISWFDLDLQEHIAIGRNSFLIPL